MPHDVHQLTATEVGAILHLSADTVRRRWRQWHAASGFPAPLLLKKWDAEAIEGWRQRNIEALQSPPEPRASVREPDRYAQAVRNLGLDKPS